MSHACGLSMCEAGQTTAVCLDALNFLTGEQHNCSAQGVRNPRGPCCPVGKVPANTHLQCKANNLNRATSAERLKGRLSASATDAEGPVVNLGWVLFKNREYEKTLVCEQLG